MLEDEVQMNEGSRARRLALLCAFLSFLSVFVAAQNSATKHLAETPLANTLFVQCNSGSHLRPVISPVSLSQDGTWRAYVEVDLQSGSDCLHTSRLWVAIGNGSYRLMYLMPPKREAVGNGMQILGWARNSKMLLIRTEEWQEGSDAPDRQQVLAVDAESGMIYQPELETMLGDKQQQRCSFHVMNAGFSSDANVDILVRAEFYTQMDADETFKDVPEAKSCPRGTETWSFNFATGESKRVSNAAQLQLFSKVEQPVAK